jgi:hypothetical protein
MYFVNITLDHCPSILHGFLAIRLNSFTEDIEPPLQAPGYPFDGLGQVGNGLADCSQALGFD